MHRIFLILLSLLIPLIVISFAWQDYQSPGPLAAEKTIIIPRSAGFRGATEILTNENIIAHPLWFKCMAYLTGNARKFKAGEYIFASNMTPSQVMELLVSGKVVVHKLTVPEGWRTIDILTLISQETALSGDMPVPEEGTLLPETYHFLHGDSRGDLVRRMQDDMNKTLAELWVKRKENLPVKTPQEALILASIVEKETGVPEERGHVAAVFVNRLNKKMPLQSDPTVQFAIEKDKGALGRALVTKDLSYDSPYNTYKYAGLPPGPICNPGRAAIEAVLNPQDSNEIYFVATGTGGHTFSTTLKEHNKNVRKYREGFKKSKRP